MAQSSEVTSPHERYTRSDYAALRAYLNKLSIDFIAERYYNPDDLEALGCASSADIKHRLDRLCDHLTQRAADTNPHVAGLLRDARQKKHWSKGVQDFLFQASESTSPTPKPSDTISLWFRSNVCASLRSEGIKTLSDLIRFISIRGSGWYKPIPRIGKGKARAIYQWLYAFPTLKGELPIFGPIEDDKENDPRCAAVRLEEVRSALVPLERIELNQLDGSQGLNRADKFCLVSARNDLQAIEAYLYKFREQEKTRRAYQKELERFLLWCIQIRNVAMSSALVGDCEAYKDFIANIPENWIGIRRPRKSENWKPFAGPLSPSSRRYAIQAIRSFFEWLVRIRYLGGNPWVAVADPLVAKSIKPMQIEKAIPEVLWEKLIADDGLLDFLSRASDEELRSKYRFRGSAIRISMPKQFRLARAAMLLMGDAGLRREEAAMATRNLLKPSTFDREIWELDVLGKRNKWRTVFCSPRTIVAIRRHWLDRELDFDFGISEIPLLSPLVIPPTEDAKRKHLGGAQENSADLAHTGGGRPERNESGFSPDGLYKMLKSVLVRIARDETLDLDPQERIALDAVSPHSFRHTFGTLTVAAETPLDVVQKVLGHASLQTTTLYVQSEKQRSVRELGAFFKKK